MRRIESFLRCFAIQNDRYYPPSNRSGIDTQFNWRPSDRSNRRVLLPRNTEWRFARKRSIVINSLRRPRSFSVGSSPRMISRFGIFNIPSRKATVRTAWDPASCWQFMSTTGRERSWDRNLVEIDEILCCVVRLNGSLPRSIRDRTKEQRGMERRERERERGARSAGWLRSKGRKYGSEFRVSRMIYRNLNPRGSRLTSSSSRLALPLSGQTKTSRVSIYLFSINAGTRTGGRVSEAGRDDGRNSWSAK